MSIHDEIAQAEQRTHWYVEEYNDLIRPGTDQTLLDFNFVATLTEDTETILDLFARTADGQAWYRWRGYAWASKYPSLSTSHASWVRARKMGGMDLKYVVEMMYEKKPLNLQVFEQLRETALELLFAEPQVIVCMCVWLSTVHYTAEALCASVMRRLLSLDDRLDPKLDWRVEAAICFDKTQYGEAHDPDAGKVPKMV